MKRRKNIAYILVIVSILLFLLSFNRIMSIRRVIVRDKDKVQDNSYVDKYDISKVSLCDIDEILLKIEDSIIDEDITLIINDKKYTYKIKDLGVGINKEKLVNEILEYEESLDYYTIYNSTTKNTFEKKVYDYEFELDDEKLNSFFSELKKVVDKAPIKGKLVMNKNRNLEYVEEVAGYSLSIQENIEIIKQNFLRKDYDKELVLLGKVQYVEDELKTINTKLSSYTTSFDDTQERKYNLIAGAGYIDGTIVYPNEVFSFYEKAGPFNKKGYVWYLGVIGNGVCQVATTVYNAQLLAGLKTVTRYNHGNLPVYVPGGLAATVSASKTFIADYRFKNNYDYPVYISAYVNKNQLTVEFWSNNLATNGLSFKLESVKLGYGSYQAYRYTYKNDILVDKEFLGNSYYYSE